MGRETLLDKVLIAAGCLFDRLPLKKVTPKNIAGNIEYDGNSFYCTVQDRNGQESINITGLKTANFTTNSTTADITINPTELIKPTWFKVFTTDDLDIGVWKENDKVTSADMDIDGNIHIVLSEPLFISLYVFRFRDSEYEVDGATGEIL